MGKIKNHLFTGILACLALSLVIACQKKDDGGSGGTTATTPVQDCNVPGNTSCNPGVYTQIAPQMQTYQWSYSGGFCGCQLGQRPVMNASWGISCAPTNWFPTSSYYSFSYNVVAFQSQNTQWMAIPQVTYSPTISGSGNNCFTNAASVCDTRNANSCSDGGICRPTAGGTYLGFCVHGTGNESYTSQVCNYEWDYYQGYVYRCRDNYYNSNNTSGGTPR